MIDIISQKKQRKDENNEKETKNIKFYAYFRN